jgi:hypothetical protein
MTPQTPSQNDRALSALLHEWKVDSPLPPRFNEHVWDRIAKQETPAVTVTALLRAWIGPVLVRPAFALSYATFLLVAGLTAGLWQAHVDTERTAAALSTRYLQMIDPYQTPRH